MLSNAYDMQQLLRNNIGERVAKHWTELDLLRLLNQSYMEVARKVSMSSGQWFVKSTSVTCTNSVITLPSDCAKPVYLEDSDGRPVSWLNSVAQRRVSRTFGIGQGLATHREAYVLKNTIEINEDSLNSTMTLWYQQRIIELHAGTAAASGAGSLTLEDSLAHNVQDDHYNGAYLEVVSGSGIGQYLITDYDAGTRVLTLTPADDPGTASYGIVPITPFECNDLIVLNATILAMSKPAANIDEKVFQMFANNLNRSRKELGEWLERRVIENQGVSIGEPYL